MELVEVIFANSLNDFNSIVDLSTINMSENKLISDSGCIQANGLSLALRMASQFPQCYVNSQIASAQR